MALPKPSAKIWIDHDKKKLMLLAPFSESFNRAIRHLPRCFNKELKAWEFDVEFVDQVVDIATRVWSSVIRPPFLLMEIFEHLTEDDLKEMYENLVKRHRGDEDKTLLTLLNKFFEDYIDLTEMTRRKKRLIRINRSESYEPEPTATGRTYQNNNVAEQTDVSQERVDLDALLESVRAIPQRTSGRRLGSRGYATVPINEEEDDD